MFGLGSDHELEVGGAAVNESAGAGWHWVCGTVGTLAAPVPTVCGPCLSNHPHLAPTREVTVTGLYYNVKNRSSRDTAENDLLID